MRHPVPRVQGHEIAGPRPLVNGAAVQEIFDALGPDSLDWQGIAGLLDQHPALRKRMADLNRTCANV